MDYSIFYRSPIGRSEPIPGRWDVFVSAYNPSDRIRSVFGRVNAARKIWVMHPEYELEPAGWPADGEIFGGAWRDEAEFCVELMETIGVDVSPNMRVCLDITGFMRPHLMCVIARLRAMGVRSIDVLYAEPVTYAQGEKTTFSRDVFEVRQVAGLEGLASQDSSNDLLVVGAGYDHRLIEEVAHHKEAARKVIVFGLPPLRADMYQQNLLRAEMANAALGEVGRRNRYFAPANDPFATAEVLQEIVQARGDITNLYLSPLSTKPQALGFVLFCVLEGSRVNGSVVFPFSTRYAQETSEGVARTWHYVVEFVG